MEKTIKKLKEKIKKLEVCIKILEKTNYNKKLKLQYCYEDLSNTNNYKYLRGYNEAIDDFFKELEKYEDKDGWLRLKMSSIYEIAEELKNGGKINDY